MIDVSIEIIEKEWPRIQESILKYVNNYDLCIQAGGHKGLYPKKLSKLFNSVITFEPYKENYNDLVLNCTECNIKHYNLALGAYSKRVSMKQTQINNTGNIVISDGNDTETVTIDSLNLESCDLIQLDIERYEMFALIGAIKTIEKHRPVIILEGPETTNNTCNRILEQLGYDEVDRAGYDTVFKYTNRPKPYCQYEERI